MMMEPVPQQRPIIDEILLHPRLSCISSAPSVKKNLFLEQISQSPIVEKFKNPLSAKNYRPIKNEMILISPRILLSAQKEQLKNNKNFDSCSSSGGESESARKNCNFYDSNMDDDDDQPLRQVGRSTSFKDDGEGYSGPN
jgi:hypothetical protein